MIPITIKILDIRPRHNDADAELVMLRRDYVLHARDDDKATAPLPKTSECPECGRGPVWVPVWFNASTGKFEAVAPSWCDDCTDDDQAKVAGVADIRQNLSVDSLRELVNVLEEAGLDNATIKIDDNGVFADERRFVVSDNGWEEV